MFVFVPKIFSSKILAISGAPPAICGALVDTLRDNNEAEAAIMPLFLGNIFELLRAKDFNRVVDNFELDMAEYFYALYFVYY